MNLLDTRTVIFSYAISNIICMIVVTILWRQNRRRFSGLGFWLADFMMQFIALVLVALRGIAPDFLSMTVSNAMIIGGTILLLIGLEHFTGKRGPQLHNYILLVVFVLVHAYFVYVLPSLAARNILFSLGLLMICSQAAWLMLRRVEPEMRPITRGVGRVFLGFCLISISRIIIDLVVPPGNDFFHSTAYDTLLLMTYQMLFIILTFGLFLMVNNRLFVDLENDITARKKAEEALYRREREFKTLVENSPDAITRFDREGYYKYVNPARARYFGRTVDEIQGKTWRDLLGPDEEEEGRIADAAIKEIFDNPREYLVEYQTKTPDGLRWVQSRGTPEFAVDGSVESVLVITRDITERKKAEEVLRESEAHFREVFDNTAHGTFIIDVTEDGNFRVGDSNRAEEILTTIRREDVMGKLLKDAFPPEIAQALHANYSQCLEVGKSIAYEQEINLPGVGRRYYYTTLAPVRDASGRFYRIIGSTLEITDLKQMEENLRLSEEKFFKAFHASPDAIIISRLKDGQFIEVNEGFSRLSEYSREEALSNSSINLGIWANPQDREECITALREDRYVRDREYNFRAKSGKILNCLYSGELIQLDNETHMLAIVRDITAQKQAERALRDSQERYQNFITQSFEAIYRTEFDHPVDITLPVETQIDLIYENAYMAECNQALADMYRFPSVDATIGIRLIDMHGSKYNPVNRSAFRKLIEGGYRSINDETVERDAQGATIWFLSNTVGIVENGFLVRMWGTSIDITERKQTEKILQAEKEFTEQALNAQSDTFFVFNPYTGKAIRWNKAFKDISGYTDEEISQMKAPDAYYDQKDLERAAQAIKMISEKGSGTVELEFICKDGRKIPFEYVASIMYNNSGEPEGFISIGRDITERKKVENALRESEWKFRTVADFTYDWEFWLKPDGNYAYISPACERITGYAAAEFHASPGLMQEVIQPDDRALFAEHLARELAISDSSRLEFRIVSRAGTERWIEHTCRPVYAQDGSWLGRRGSNRDITERKQVEDILRLRLRLNEFALAHSLNELMQKALDEIGLITNSPIGFYHFVEPDGKTLSLQAWSTRTEKEFCKAEGKGMHYSIDQAGVWVDCVYQKKAVIHNDYASLPHRKGMPAGHAQVVRELVVPTLRNGRVVSILGIGNKPSNYEDKDVELVAYIADVVWVIVERKRAEEKLRQLSRAVEQSPASIVITDTMGSIEYVNPKFTEVTGYTLEEAIGKNPRILKTEHTPKATHRQLWDTITSGREWRGEFVNRKKNGELFQEAASISPIIDNNGITTHYMAVKEDITATKLNEQKLQEVNKQLKLQLGQIQSLQAELREQAIRDPLTGLYNRRYLNETLERELARAVRENHPVSFAMIDIDHFKNINDTFGHDAGDVVLKKLATQILTQTRVVDIVCRYGGEEFLVILPNVTAAGASTIAERWRRSFMGTTMPLGHSDIQPTISCGIAEFPLNGHTGEDLISTADKALYQAKAAGRNQVAIWKKEEAG